jgi:L-ascorbate metabolism protein UlaG (beta-lactamase superfamily)
MKLTKYTHACVVLEDQGSKLVIDPGAFTKDFGDLGNIVAVVVTHVHGDHYSADHLNAILAKNPSALIFTVPEVADDFKHDNVQVVTPGHETSVDPFKLRFLGEQHKLIHASIPPIHNTAVMVNDAFYYPGDSFTLPDKPVKVLGVPSNAPWATAGESMDFVATVNPELSFPTHNGLLNDFGQQTYNSSINHICQQADILFKELKPGESLDF